MTQVALLTNFVATTSCSFKIRNLACEHECSGKLQACDIPLGRQDYLGRGCENDAGNSVRGGHFQCRFLVHIYSSCKIRREMKNRVVRDDKWYLDAIVTAE